MKGRTASFNTYLALAIALVVFAALGCKTAEERKRAKTYTTLWLMLETPPGSPETNSVTQVEVAGITLACHSRPFLTEEDLDQATIVASPGGGQSLRLIFNEHGRLVVDQLTSQYRQRRVIFFAEFGVKYKNNSKKTVLKKRWLAAPKITRRVTDGTVVFTPDATPEELDEIVLGLQNAIKEAKKPWVF